MNTTTLFDLNQTAATAAATVLGKDEYTTENMKLEAFNAAGHEKPDYAQWNTFFHQNLDHYANLKLQPSPAALAAKAAAATQTTKP
jgi:hypothetical protein